MEKSKITQRGKVTFYKRTAAVFVMMIKQAIRKQKKPQLENMCYYSQLSLNWTLREIITLVLKTLS